MFTKNGAPINYNMKNHQDHVLKSSKLFIPNLKKIQDNKIINSSIDLNLNLVNNCCSKKCCPSPFTCYNGCLCLSELQKKKLAQKKY
jgi:hypothetical protein